MNAPSPQKDNPLHGVTLKAMVTELVAHFGWAELVRRIQINSFHVNPSVASSLKFLRQTPWARAKVEGLYLFMQRERARTAKAMGMAPAAALQPPTAAAFGSWASPISAELISAHTLRLGQVAVLDQDVFWTEGRPQEQGRNVLVWCSAQGETVDLTPAPLNVRSRVHEYGGGAFMVGRRAGFFVNDSDQQIWRLRAGQAPQPLTAEPGTRYADLELDAQHKRLIGVREDHRTGGAQPRNELVSIRLANGASQVLAQGQDFYSNPRLSPDGTQLCWLSWSHPNMPWDATQLWLAGVLPSGELGPATLVAGGDDESIFQPSWSPQGELYFVSDRSGWWNLYRMVRGSVQAVYPMAAEFGRPQWVFGLSTYGFDASGQVVCTYLQNGRAHLVQIKSEGVIESIATPFCSIESLQVGTDFAVFVGATETAAEAVVRLDLRTGKWRTLRESSSTSVPAAFVSVAQPITFSTEQGMQAHAFYYPPTNPYFSSLPGERPPLIVVGHGGPTGTTNAALRWPYQYWTSRGFAVVDVNYGGSTGYGKAYRERLQGQWGVVDVDDLIHAARSLIERGLVDPARVVVRGSSAGGYTALSALTFRSFFKAGASHYGIGDLEALAQETHKFEARYLDRLIGPYPEQRALYIERSPVHHSAKLNSPMILFQGTDDKAVPPAQAQAMFEAVRAKALPVAYLLFKGEGHGFRRADTLQRVLQAELAFYAHVFGFTPAGPAVALEIHNA